MNIRQRQMIHERILLEGTVQELCVKVTAVAISSLFDQASEWVTGEMFIY